MPASVLRFVRYRFDAEQKVDDVAYPHDGETNSRDGYALHHDKAREHYRRHRSDNRKFRFQRHRFSFDETFQVFFIQRCAYKPVV